MAAQTIGAVVSVLHRFLCYVLLRWISGKFWPVVVGLAGTYVLVWLYEDAKLANLEHRDVMERHARSGAPAVDRDAKPVIPPSSNGVKASYAQVVKKEDEDAKPGQLNQLDPAADNALTTTGVPVEIEARQVGPIPSRPSILAFFTGAPTASRVANRIALAINVLLLFFVLDNALGPIVYPHLRLDDLAFTRIGGVGDSWANVVTRANSNETARVIYRATQPIGSWQYGPVLAFSPTQDFVATAKLDGLSPSTQYEYRIGSGAAPLTAHEAFIRAPAQRFTTAPDPDLSHVGGSHFTFAASSCLKPGFPYSPLRSKLAMPGVRHLANDIASRGIEWLLLLGDFIYVDVPFYEGPKLSAYFKQYRQTYGSPDLRAVYEQIPIVHIYDDHEISNDYAGNGNASVDPTFNVANTAYQAYNGAGNPPGPANENFYNFRHGDAAFFVFDTRQYRTANSAPDDENKTMLGPKQKAAFLDWLSSVNSTVTWKFVVSSVPVNSLWDHGGYSSDDNWAAFLTERSELLDVMQWVPNVIILSGDRHEFAAVSLRTSVTEFSISPLNQFYLPIRTLNQKQGRGVATAAGPAEDLLLKYLPDGNSKYTTFEVDTRVANKPEVRATVVIDGQEAWTLRILGKPRGQPTRLGALRQTLAELFNFRRLSFFS